MDQSPKVPDARSELLKYIDLANRAGKKYAKKYERYEPECQAEARYIVTLVFLEQFGLIQATDNVERFLRTRISSRLSDYFRNKVNHEKNQSESQQTTTFVQSKEDWRNDIAMMDMMEQVFPDAPQIFRLWRDGFLLEDMKFLHKESYRAVNEMLKIRNKLARSRKKLIEGTHGITS